MFNNFLDDKKLENYMGVEPKIEGKKNQMDGENNGKPYEKKLWMVYMDVSKNRCFGPPNHPFFGGFSII